MMKSAHDALMEQVFEDAESRKSKHDQSVREQIGVCLHDELSAQIAATIPEPSQQEWDAASARRVAD